MSPALLLIPLYAFVAFCLVDIFTAEQVRRLPRWAWAVISLNALGGVIYLLVGRVRGKHEYQRGYQAATSTLTTAGDTVRAVVGDPASLDYDLRQWAASRQAALRAAATRTEPFELPAWFVPLANDLGSLLDPVGYDRWSFTPTDPFVRGYQAALRDGCAAPVPAERP